MKIKILQRGFNFSQDGPGNRLVYHLQGCNFRCPWCSNPESIPPEGVIMLPEDEISDENCPKGKLVNNKLDREYCKKCDKECLKRFSGKIRFSCSESDVKDVTDEIVSSKMMFFGGGGVTFTGGEPTVQFEALREILTFCNENGVHTAIESNASHKRLNEISKLVDHMIVDFKHYDCEKHKSVIGVPNDTVLDNLKMLADTRDQLLIHIPLIHGFNSSKDDALKFAETIKGFDNDNICVEALRYHEYGKDKWLQSGMEYSVNDGFVSDEEYREFIEVLKENSINVVRT